ncbi:MAG: MATE family efflux transporter [Phycisphaerales bacterium]
MPPAKTHPVGAKSPLRELFAVAGPAIITTLSPAIMQFVDAIPVARLGPTAVAAQGTGSMPAFIVIGTLMGFLAVVNTFASQHFGAHRYERCGMYGWTAIWISLVGAIVVAPLAFFVEDFFRLLGHGTGSDAARELLRMETQYAAILLAFAVFPGAAARALAQFFYGVQRPRVVVFSTIAGNAVNIAASYVLIFGVAGFPKLGIAGAAIGTVLGHLVELAIPLWLFLSREFDAQFRTRSVWKPSWKAIREVSRIGWPGGLHFGNEIACWGLFMAWVVPAAVAPAQAPAAIAGSFIALNWLKLGFLPVFGLSSGVTAVVGAQIGRRDLDAAYHRGMLGVRIGVLYMIALGVVMLILREPMTRVFLDKDAALADPALAAATLKAGAQIIALMAIFQAFDALGIVLGGALRGAGDTAWPGLVVVGLAWTVLIGGGLIVGAALPSLGSAGPWLAAGLFLTLAGVALLQRFRGGRWRSISIFDDDDAPSSPLAGVS